MINKEKVLTTEELIEAIKEGRDLSTFKSTTPVPNAKQTVIILFDNGQARVVSTDVDSALIISSNEDTTYSELMISSSDLPDMLGRSIETVIGTVTGLTQNMSEIQKKMYLAAVVSTVHAALGEVVENVMGSEYTQGKQEINEDIPQTGRKIYN